jgi:hypothetical protein
MLDFVIVVGVILAALGLFGMNRLRILRKEERRPQPLMILPPEDQPEWTEYARNLRPPSETS